MHFGKIFHFQIRKMQMVILKKKVVKLIAVGKDKFGLSLEFEHIVVRDKELNIFIPYKNSIVNAYNTVIYYENFNDCKFSKTIQCAAYMASIDFDKSTKGNFYSLKVKKFGTIYRYKKEKAMPIDKAMTYQFRSGRYKSLSQKGITYEKTA